MHEDVAAHGASDCAGGHGRLHPAQQLLILQTQSAREQHGDAESSSAREVVGANAGSATRIIPFDIMITFAPPATASAVRVAMSASGSRNCGEVIPWSSAQMTETPAWSMTRLRRMDLPTPLITTTSFLGRAAAR